MKPRLIKIINKLKNYKNKLKIRVKQLQEKTELPDSKIKRGALGMITVFSIFGISWFGSKLPAVAKDLVPKNNNNPSPGITPTSQSKPTDETITEIIGGMAAVICGAAATSTSYLLGGVCGIIVVIAIKRLEGK